MAIGLPSKIRIKKLLKSIAIMLTLDFKLNESVCTNDAPIFKFWSGAKFIFEAINELVKAKHQIHTVTNSGKPIIKIDNIKTYHEVRKSYESTDT